jgi:hypothetical protein
MRLVDNQRQRGGDNSVNVQAGTVVLGPSYAEVRQIALDVFRDNFYKLADVAREVALERAEFITEQFFDRLQARHPEALEQARQPDMQRALFKVQEEFACSGDEDLGDILVEMLVARSVQPARSLTQMVLTEALYTAPKITSEGMANLSVLYYLVYTHHAEVESIEQLKQLLRRDLTPFVDKISTSSAVWRHLEYAGCVSISMGQRANIETQFREQYAGLFSKGFLPGLVPDEVQHTSLVIPCRRDPAFLQLNVLGRPELDDSIRRLGFTHLESVLVDLLTTNLMTPDEVKEEITGIDPAIRKLLSVWDTTNAIHSTLSTVGYGIATANFSHVTGAPLDVDEWFEE